MGLFGSSQKYILGLDVGSAWIKAVLITTKSGSSVPQFSKIVCIKNYSDPKSAIRQILNEIKVKPTCVVTCLDSKDTEMIIESFIARNPHEVEKLAELKMREFNTTDYAISFAPLKGPVTGPDGTPSYPVLYVSAEKDKVNQFKNLFLSLGITSDVLIMDIDQLAAINALELDQASIGTTCLIEGGATTTNITILRDGLIVYMNKICNDGGAYFTDNLAKNLGISREEAEELKIKNGIGAVSDSRSSFSNLFSSFDSSLEIDRENKGLTQDDKYLSNFKEILENYFDKIIQQLKNFQDKHSLQIKEIILTGGLACIKNINGYMKNYFTNSGLSVSSVMIADSSYLSSLNCPEEEKQVYVVALGLALRGLVE